MTKFWELLEESVIVQSTLALGLTGVASYLWIVEKPVPDPLMLLLGLAWGFYFKSKVDVAVKKTVSKLTK